MSVYYIASLTINYSIPQNLGNKAKARDHDPPGYFRSQMYPGYEVATKLEQEMILTLNRIRNLRQAFKITGRKSQVARSFLSFFGAEILVLFRSRSLYTRLNV